MKLKTLGKNTLIYAVGNICLRAGSFLLIPVYTHALSVSDYGQLANLLVTIQVMVWVMSVSAETSLVRFLKHYEREDLVSELMGSAFAITTVGSVLVSLVTIGMLSTFFSSILHTDTVNSLLLLACVVASLQAFCRNFLAYYRAQNEPYKFTFVSVISVPFMLLLSYVFLYHYKWGVEGALLAAAAAHAVMFVVLALNILPRTGFGIKTVLVKELLEFGTPLVFSMSAWFVMGSSGIYFLSYFAGLDSAGIYSLGQKFAYIAVIVLLLPFQLAYEPIVFQHIEEEGIQDKIARMLTYFMIAFAFLSLFIVVGTRYLLPLAAPPEYASAFTVVLFFLPVVMFEGIYSIGATLLQVVKKTKILGVSSLIFMLLCLGMNYVLVPRFGWYGAVFSVNITYLIASIAILTLGIRAFPVQLELGRLMVSIVVFLVFIFSAVGLEIANPVFYSLTQLTTFFAVVALLLFAGFFKEEEKAAIRNLLSVIKTRTAQ